MAINGTNFCMPQKGLPKKGNAFASHKYAGKSALRYELGISILRGDLVWIQGPYPAGKYSNIIIFNKVLTNFLEPERPMTATTGTRTRSSAQKMMRIRRRIWRCRAGRGRGMRRSTGG
jgi:hypothetical protein